MTSEMAKHVGIASSVQSQNQGSLWKDESSASTPFSVFPQMEAFFLKIQMLMYRDNWIVAYPY